MNFEKTPIDGVFIATTSPFIDNRGAFARLFCENDLKPVIGKRHIVQINHSKTKTIGAVRGMHFQKPPFAEMKMIRCLKGKVFDVAVDLRAGSKTFLKHYALELNPENSKMIIIPEGFAHGFQVLEEDSELLYLHTEFYNKDYEDGLSYADPLLNIKWPIPIKDLSDRDKNHQLITPSFTGIEI
ncbi:MAG: dTDP-4-dehydrorhamnose 3,5-epimerase [Alphaproteobacteria bacterium]